MVHRQRARRHDRPPLPSADALHAAVTKPLAAAAASETPRSLADRGPSRSAPSAAALIAKGEAAVRLGDHRRANEAFAAARAVQELERSRSASPPGGSRVRPTAPARSPNSDSSGFASSSPRSRALRPRAPSRRRPPTSESPSTPLPRRTCARAHHRRPVRTLHRACRRRLREPRGRVDVDAVARAIGDILAGVGVRTGGARGRRHGRAERYRSSLGRQRGGTRRRRPRRAVALAPVCGGG